MSNKKSDMGKPKSVLMGVIGFIILVLADQWTKKMAVLRLKDQDPIVLIKNVFELYYLENRGAAFGIFQGKRVIFLIITIIILLFLAYCFWRIPYTRKYATLRGVLVLIAAGAVGNFIDRMYNGYVVDFFYFELIDFPVFNVADIYVTTAAIALIILVIFYYKDEDFEFLGGKKAKKTKA